MEYIYGLDNADYQTYKQYLDQCKLTIQDRGQKRTVLDISKIDQEIKDKILQLKHKKIQNLEKSIIYNSNAGCGKTYALEQLCRNQLKGQDILYIVYNKRNQMEALSKFPMNVTVKTVNSICYKHINDYVKYKKIKHEKIDSLKGKIKQLYKDRMNKYQIYHLTEILQNTFEYLQRQKPEQSIKYYDETHQFKQTELQDIQEGYDMFMTQIEELKYILLDAQLYQANIYFDQFSKYIQKYDVVLFDEIQDSSLVQFKFIQHYKNQCKQIFGAGDVKQQLYMYKNKNQMNIQQILAQFDKIEELNVSYRYNTEIAKFVENRFSCQHESNVQPQYDQSIQIIKNFNFKNIQNPCAILVHSNKQVFDLFVQAHLHGFDENKLFVQLDEKYTKYNQNQKLINNYFQIYNKNDWKLYLQKIQKIVTDKEADGTNQIPTSQKVQIMTIHKSKGLEFDEVFVIDINKDYKTQEEMCQQYVALTRAKQKLFIQFK